MCERSISIIVGAVALACVVVADVPMAQVLQAEAVPHRIPPNTEALERMMDRASGELGRFGLLLADTKAGTLKVSLSQPPSYWEHRRYPHELVRHRRVGDGPPPSPPNEHRLDWGISGTNRFLVRRGEEFFEAAVTPAWLDKVEAVAIRLDEAWRASATEPYPAPIHTDMMRACVVLGNEVTVGFLPLAELDHLESRGPAYYPDLMSEQHYRYRDAFFDFYEIGEAAFRDSTLEWRPITKPTFKPRHPRDSDTANPLPELDPAITPVPSSTPGDEVVPSSPGELPTD